MKKIYGWCLAFSFVVLVGCGGGGGTDSGQQQPQASNTEPTANAGPIQSVVAGALVTLDGSASSDANGDLLTYSWSLTSRPTGSAAALASATSAKPTFTADLAGNYVASLAVNDGKVNSTATTVMVTAAVANAAPIANAGVAQNVVVGALVILDGSASSDANGEPLTYSWLLTSIPPGSAAPQTVTSLVKPSFFADVAGTYVARLTVNDGKVNSVPSTVTVTAAVANAAPVANAGTAQNVTTGMLVTLDGAGSSDANGDLLTYSWSLTGKPAGSTAALTSTTSARPSLTVDLAGTYVATLTVNDGKVNSNTAPVTITVTAPKIIGVAYLARNNMTVTLVSFTTQDLGNGYLRYTATYKQANNTAVAIDEGSLKLFFGNATAEPQYGFFNRVLPGDAFALTRSYFWDILSTSIPDVLMYDADGFSSATPVSGSLQWKFPIR